MKIAQLFGKGKTVFSCEVFPPKKTSPVDSIYKTLDGLKDIHPDFISVTFGAGGSSNVNQSTAEIASIIQNQYHITAMAHLTCVGCTKGEATEILAQLKNSGVENVLALRGDRNPDFPPKEDFLHADELVSFIHRRGDFGVSAACYPEGHPESPDLITDVRYLKQKVDAGAQRPPRRPAGGRHGLRHRPDRRPDGRRGGRHPPVHHEQPRRGQTDQREHRLHPKRLIQIGVMR